MKNKILLLILISIFLSQSVSALTANSSNYSVSMFGTGLAASNQSSANYTSVSITEAKGTTRNAESSSLTANIGFFENTVYHRTVSITSFPPYPKSAVQGSIIRLSVSALNAQSVWANLTLPTGAHEIIVLINNGSAYYTEYYTANVIGVYTVTFYANSSQGNLASSIETFEITSAVIPPITPPPGGGGGTTIEKCAYIWDCSSWSICQQGKQQRECKNIGNCTGTEGKPIESRECSDALFDVIMKLKQVELTLNETLKFGIDLTEKKGIEKIDVQLKYSIINSNNAEIFSQIETRAIQGNLTFEKEISEIKLKDGEYILRIDIIYGNQQRAFAEQKFEVKNGGIQPISKKSNLPNILFYIFLIIIALIITFFIFMAIKRRKRKKDYQEIVSARKISEVKQKHFEKVYVKGEEYLEIKPKPISKIEIKSEMPLEVSTPVKNIFSKLRKLLGDLFSRHKKYPKNSITGLIGKKVYLESGEYFGTIEDIILGASRIESLKIKTDKKYKLDKKGIIISYRQVKSVGEIMILNKAVSEHLENLS